MSFWSTSTGENLAAKSNEEAQTYAPESGSLDPIPGKSKVRAFIKDAKWDAYQDANFIKIRWDVLKPDEYANRVVFQKLWVRDDDPNAKDPAKKRDNALKMLRKIDALCGGKLGAAGVEPTDDSLLLALGDKQMVIAVELWEMKDRDGNPISGNWVRDVLPCEGTALEIGEAPKPVTDDLDTDEIPF